MHCRNITGPMSISAVIPTKNRKQQLLEAIASVVNQSFKVDEIIVVDDCSEKKLNIDDIPDNAGKELIQIFYNDSSKGANYCRNLGVEKAIGDIIMFLDDDDTWEPDKVRNQISVFKQNPECGLVYTGKIFVSSKDRNHIIRKVKPGKRGDLKAEIFKNNWIGSTSCIAIRKDVFIQSGGFDDSLQSLQDYDLYIRVCQISPVDHDNSCNIRYTVHNVSESQISGQIDRHLESISIIDSKYSGLLDRKGKRLFQGFQAYILGKAYLKTDPQRSIRPLFRSFCSINKLKALYLLSVAIFKVIFSIGKKT